MYDPQGWGKRAERWLGSAQASQTDTTLLKRGWQQCFARNPVGTSTNPVRVAADLPGIRPRLEKVANETLVGKHCLTSEKLPSDWYL